MIAKPRRPFRTITKPTGTFSSVEPTIIRTRLELPRLARRRLAGRREGGRGSRHARRRDWHAWSGDRDALRGRPYLGSHVVNSPLQLGATLLLLLLELFHGELSNVLLADLDDLVQLLGHDLQAIVGVLVDGLDCLLQLGSVLRGDHACHRVHELRDVASRQNCLVLGHLDRRAGRELEKLLDELREVHEDRGEMEVLVLVVLLEHDRLVGPLEDQVRARPHPRVCDLLQERLGVVTGEPGERLDVPVEAVLGRDVRLVVDHVALEALEPLALGVADVLHGRCEPDLVGHHRVDQRAVVLRDVRDRPVNDLALLRAHFLREEQKKADVETKWSK